jgi:hypothetical protein
MDSDAKELGHVRGAAGDRSGIPGIECGRTFLRWQQLPQSKIASVAIDPYESAIELVSVENK